VVTDEGALTANRTQLAASWTSADPESGIREFQYAIGTTPGGTEVKPFTSTTQNSIVVTGLNLQPGTTYYFAVKATNAAGLTSDIGISDGIRYDAAYQPQTKIIPAVTETSGEFTGIALLAPTAMTVVLRAYDTNGAMVFGPGIRNPSTIALAAGQQYARLIPELMGLQDFDGWIEAEASSPGLGVFTATGAWDGTTLDGSVARDTSADFLLFHSGASAVLVNPSPRAANVMMNSLSSPGTQSLSIPARGRVVIPLAGPLRVQSSEPLAAVERLDAPGKLAINEAAPIADAQAVVVFPHAVTGSGYTSTLTLANVTGATETVSVGFGASTKTLTLNPNTSTRFSVGDTSGISTGSVKITASTPSGQAAVLGILDIENETGLVTMGARPAATQFVFPHVANGNGLYTGLAFASGNSPATITIEVYSAAGGSPQTATVAIGANQQLSRLLSELVTGAANQVGGYIRIRADQPIWAWEIYASGQAMGSGPPL
jgi:hypothetical protein